MPVSDYMQTNVITTSPSTPIWVAQRIMLENKIRHLPVVEEGKLVGILTEGRLRNLVSLLAKSEIGGSMAEKR